MLVSTDRPGQIFRTKSPSKALLSPSDYSDSSKITGKGIYSKYNIDFKRQSFKHSREVASYDNDNRLKNLLSERFKLLTTEFKKLRQNWWGDI